MTPRRVLVLNTAAFALCFAVWVLYSIAVVPLAPRLDLDPASKGLLLAAPILLGALLRLPVGLLSNRYGARPVFTGLMVIAAVPTFLAGSARSWAGHLMASAALGLVGASFAVGVFAVSSWYPAARRGAALGIFGAGNIGTALTSLGGPWLLLAVGVENTFRIYALALLAMGILYGLLMEDRPEALGTGQPLARTLAPLGEIRTWRFGLYYVVTFGGFVAMSLKLPSAYTALYDLPVTTAGLYTTTFTLLASLIRGPGGWISDRIGARRCLLACLTLITLSSLVLGFGPLPLPIFAAVALVAGLAMGVGNAAVFKYVAQYFPWDVGTVGGLVGLIGGLGGFFLPLGAGLLEKAAGTGRAGFLALGALSGATLALQVLVVHRLVREEQDVLQAQPEPVPVPAGEPALEVRREWAAVVVAVRGRLDESTIEEFTSRVRQEITPDLERLDLDLSGCRLVSSAGLNAILIADRELRKTGARMRIAAAPPAIHRILEMTGITRRIEVV